MAPPKNFEPEWYNYLYPNLNSYTNLPPAASAHHRTYYNGRALRHGYIFGYKAAAVDPAKVWDPLKALGTLYQPPYRQLDYKNSKIFQFNPPDLTLAMTMTAVESPDLGYATGMPNSGVGYANTALELVFDRTEEIARANKDKGKHASKWRTLGVQADLFDLFRVISGGDSSTLGQYTDVVYDPYLEGDVQGGSLNSLTGQFIDATVTGSQVVFKSFAVVFNPNMAVHVLQMNSMSFSYTRFTTDLVPTTMKIAMDLSISNMGTMAHVTKSGPVGSTDTTNPAEPPPGVPPPTPNPKNW